MMKYRSIKKEKLKKVRLEIRIDKDLKDSWKVQCESKRISLTNFIISSVENRMQDNERREVLVFIEKQDYIFSKIDTNINQLARYVNTEKRMMSNDTLDYFNKLLGEIKGLKLRQNEIIYKVYSLLSK